MKCDGHFVFVAIMEVVSMSTFVKYYIEIV